MAIENLPRPWVLAALTGLKVTELFDQPEDGPADGRRERALPRPEARRRRAPDAPRDRRAEAPLEGHLN
jgi:hypothetical protein